MSSTSFEAPLRLKPSVSFLLTTILVVVYFGAVLIVFVVPIPIGFSISLAVVAAASGVYVIRRYALLIAPNSIVMAIMEGDGGWLVRQKNGEEYRVSLLKDTFVSLPLVVLNFRKDEKKRFGMILVRGMLTDEVFRQLRVRLRLSKPE
ncbi:MAG: hypothetical protein OEX19_10480 [Gammaproteobacteria bacterium]|nr:hypothetical protein [Gammaproteobacteria bacterium]